MLEPRDWCAELLAALTAQPVAWREPGELAEALGWDPESTLDRLAILDAEGWLEASDRPGGPVVFLSTLGAERLGIRLVEIGQSMELRWAEVGDPEPPPPTARNVCSAERAAAMEFVLDPEPPPDVQAERAEAARIEAAALSRLDRRAADDLKRGLPRPTLLVGHGLSPWPGPARASKPPCPACGGEPLDTHAYCLVCDAWGLDAILFPGGRSPRPKSQPAPARPTAPRDRDPQALSARARRKQRRRRKLESLKGRTGAGRPLASA